MADAARGNSDASHRSFPGNSNGAPTKSNLKCMQRAKKSCKSGRPTLVFTFQNGLRKVSFYTISSSGKGPSLSVIW